MEPFLARSFEILKLEEYQITQLQAKETKLQRCLTPFEIQTFLNLQSSQDFYNIPYDDQHQAAHANKIRQKIKTLIKYLPFNALDVQSFHQFDWIIRMKLDPNELQFTGSFRRGKKLEEAV